MLMAMFSPKRLSCGVLIVSAERELLLCHVTGQHHWDLPKGGLHAGESAVQAAVRETQEETGLCLEASTLVDLGRFDYRPRKDLHLFATLMPRFDVAALHCESQFSDLASGRRLPEMDGFDWVDFAAVPRHCSAKMAAVLADRIDLRRLFERLSARPAPPARPPARRAMAQQVEAH